MIDLIPSMNFSTVFKEISQLYPQCVSLKNAVLKESGGFLLPEITLIHDTIDELYGNFENEEQDWQRLMNWNIACGIRAYAREQFQKKQKYIFLKDVSISDIEQRFYENLLPKGLGFEGMLQVYTRNIEPGLEMCWGLKPIEPNPELANYHWVVHSKDGQSVAHVDQKGDFIELDGEDHKPNDSKKELTRKKKRKQGE